MIVKIHRRVILNHGLNRVTFETVASTDFWDTRELVLRLQLLVY